MWAKICPSGCTSGTTRREYVSAGTAAASATTLPIAASNWCRNSARNVGGAACAPQADAATKIMISVPAARTIPVFCIGLPRVGRREALPRGGRRARWPCARGRTRRPARRRRSVALRRFLDSRLALHGSALRAGEMRANRLVVLDLDGGRQRGLSGELVQLREEQRGAAQPVLELRVG